MAEKNDPVVFQANFKSPGGTLFNIYAQSDAEFEHYLTLAPEFIAKIVAVESAFTQASVVANAVPVAPPVQQPPQQWQQPAQPAQPAAPPAPQPAQAPYTGPGHVCAHGPMKFVQAGVSQRTGQAYPAFWACPQPKGAPDKCKSIWVG